MTWPTNPTRAEVLRLLEQNRALAMWVISREETAVLIGLLRETGVDRAGHVNLVSAPDERPSAVGDLVKSCPHAPPNAACRPCIALWLTYLDDEE